MIENKFGNMSAVDITANKEKVEKPTPGAYYGIIKNCYPTQFTDRNGNVKNLLQVDLDITEGKFANYGVRKAEASGSQYWALSKKLDIPASPEDTKAAANIKKLWTAVADSNVGFTFNEDAPAFDEHQLIGKRVGIMIGGQEKIFAKTANGTNELIKFVNPTILWFMAISKVATETKVPEIRPLNEADQAKWDEYQASKNGTQSGFSAPAEADEDLPF